MSYFFLVLIFFFLMNGDNETRVTSPVLVEVFCLKNESLVKRDLSSQLDSASFSSSAHNNLGETTGMLI